MKHLIRFLRLNLSAILIVSLLVNVALGVVSFVLQPLWRAAAVTTAVAATKATAEVQESAAVARAKSKEKAKARLKRIATAIPLAGLGAAAYFEYADYQEWLEENPDGTFGNYSQDVLTLSQEVAGEVVEELPDIPGVDADALMKRMASVLDRAEALIE